MFQLNSTLTLTIIISTLIAITGVAIYVQSARIENYKQQLQNSATTAKVVEEAHKTASFEQKQAITFNKDKDSINEVNITNLPDGNYTISF